MKIPDKATEHFESAQLLFQHGRYRDSVSRAYYTVYTAVEDYVGLLPTGPWSHRSIRGAFTAKLISDGVSRSQARELGRKFVESFDARLEADYNRMPITESLASRMLANAQVIFDWIEKEVKP